MKTYKDFKTFIEQPKYLGTVWSCVCSDAEKEGFKKWQVRLYTIFYRRKAITNRLKYVCKKIGKFLWLGFVCFGLFMLSINLHNLIKSTTRKNDMQSIESLIHICKESPDVCNKVVKIYKGI